MFQSFNELNVKSNKATTATTLKEKGVTFGIRVPCDLRFDHVKIRTITLPKRLYHTTRSPIKNLKDTILYTSYDRMQSIAHGLANYSRKPLYVYTLKPKVRNVKVVLYSRQRRPKNNSNRAGIKYNSLSNEATVISGFLGLGRITQKNIISQNFKEGTGDNMIFGQILCDNLGINGIRNEINQNEFAICKPSKFFKITNVETIDANIAHRLGHPEFMREYNSSGKFKSAKYKIDPKINKNFKRAAKINVRRLFNNIQIPK